MGSKGQGQTAVSTEGAYSRINTQYFNNLPPTLNWPKSGRSVGIQDFNRVCGTAGCDYFRGEKVTVGEGGEVMDTFGGPM